MSESTSEAIGNATEWERFECSPWRVARVRTATGLLHPAYIQRVDSAEAALVPPSFLSAQYVDAFALDIPDAPARLNGGNSCRWIEPVHVGDVLEKRSVVTDCVIKDGTAARLEIYTITTEYRQECDHRTVAELEYTAIRRYPLGDDSDDSGVTNTRAGKTDSTDPIVPEGDLFLVAHTTPREVVAYAVATDDMYEPHYDLKTARDMGFPSTIIHGLMKLGWFAAAALKDAGNHYVVSSLSAAYRGMDFTTDSFSVWGYARRDKATDELQYELAGYSASGQKTTLGQVRLEPRDLQHYEKERKNQ